MFIQLCLLFAYFFTTTSCSLGACNLRCSPFQGETVFEILYGCWRFSAALHSYLIDQVISLFLYAHTLTFFFTTVSTTDLERKPASSPNLKLCTGVPSLRLLPAFSPERLLLRKVHVFLCCSQLTELDECKHSCFYRKDGEVTLFPSPNRQRYLSFQGLAHRWLTCFGLSTSLLLPFPFVWCSTHTAYSLAAP